MAGKGFQDLKNMDSSPGRTATNGSNKKEIFVKEELKIAVKLSLDKFRYDEEQKGEILCNFPLLYLKDFANW